MIVYHVSPSYNRDSIASSGLLSGSVVTESWAEADTFAEFYRSVEPQPHDVWIADLDGDRIEPDPDYSDAGIDGTWVLRDGLSASRLTMFEERN